jgi:DNA (cytosine-5)-methyltransferase 1
MATDAATAKFTFAEFFSGIGGFRVGLEASGGTCVFACEYCRFATKNYCDNFPSGPLPVGDIRQLHSAQVPRHDVLVGGFPCQSFSNAGRLGAFDDPRGQLLCAPAHLNLCPVCLALPFALPLRSRKTCAEPNVDGSTRRRSHELVRIISECRPRAVLLENVRGLLTNAEALAEVLAALAGAGYADVELSLYDAALLVPQRRKRLFLVGFRDAAARRAFSWPELPALRRTADEVLEDRTSTTTGVDELAVPVHKWRKVEASAYFAKFPGARLLPAGALAQTLQTTYKSGWLLYSQFVPSSSSSVPPPSRGESLSEGGSEGGEAEGATTPPRFFSPRECARLMGFPEHFSLARSPEGIAYRQLGNAVCPPVVGALGVAIWHALESSDAGRAGGVAPPHLPSAAALMQCGAIALALELALAASAEGREPARCWLKHKALRDLGMPDVQRSVQPDRQIGLHEEGGTCTSADGCGGGRDEEHLPRASTSTAGAAFHEDADSAAWITEWAGPFPIDRIISVARRRCADGGASASGLERPRARPTLQQERSREAPAQTLPAPTAAIKAEVGREAARCMRAWQAARAISNSARVP